MREMTGRYVLHGTYLSGPTYKVALLLSLLGHKFDYVHTNLQAGKQKEPEFLAKNHFGQVPCLTDRRTGFSIAQSGVILEYLAETEKRFLPTSDIARLRAREWILWDFDRLVPNIYRPRARKLGFRPADPETLRMYTNDGNAALAFLDRHLANGSWLVDQEPTIADVDLYGVVSYAPEADFELAHYPGLQAWMLRIQALPGFRSADKLLPHKDATNV
jgi:glutathione S-transferase